MDAPLCVGRCQPRDGASGVHWLFWFVVQPQQHLGAYWDATCGVVSVKIIIIIESMMDNKPKRTHNGMSSVDLNHHRAFVQGAAWELGWTPAPPLDLRITDEAGKQLVARAVITVSGQVGVMPLGVQFSVEGGGDVAAPPPPAAATNASAPTPKAAPPAPITTPAASSGSCADVPIPDSLFSCAQQQQWGKVCLLVVAQHSMHDYSVALLLKHLVFNRQ